MSPLRQKKSDQKIIMEMSTPDNESLGMLLRKLRLERSLDISDVAEETKIPPATIRAMEDDDYRSLPALAFARGFYAIYSDLLNLDQEEIVERFLSEYKSGDFSAKADAASPTLKGKQIGSMAERPTHFLRTAIGITVLAVILIGAGICWYAGYNPANHVSQWLRSFQEPEIEIIEQTTSNPDSQ
ncbi:MAG: helix-turn-helix domain-containing protein [Desulfofustis sp.]